MAGLKAAPMPCYPAAVNEAGREVPARKEARERESGRILPFPTRISLGKGKSRQKQIGRADQAESGVADLRKYERGAEQDDYARRMMINVVAFAFIMMLTLAGLWLAGELALLRKKQDCALSGHKNCVDVDWHARNR
jgi:hypothetical protein